MNKAVIAGIVVLGALAAGLYLRQGAPGPAAGPTEGAETAGAPEAEGAGAGAAGGKGGAMAEVRVPALEGLAQMGALAFRAKCASCHGERAEGRRGVAPPLVHDYYKPSHHGDAAFVLAARTGVRAHHWRFGDMPPVRGVTEAEIRSIIAYVRALQKANGIY